MKPAERHFSPEAFTGYLRAGLPIDHPVPGTPRLILFFDPVGQRVGLRGPAVSGETATPTGLEHLSVQLVHYEGRRMIEIAVTDRRLFGDAYPLLCAVADRVQLDHQTLTAALAETLRRLGHLLRPEETLSHETEIGLLGELLLIAGLTHVAGTSTALQAWRGGADEEHDFGLADHDIEVKTSTSERRKHWISSPGQLVATGDRPLWLVSIQVTGAGEGGRTLADLIGATRTLFETSGNRGRFDKQLSAAGWRDHHTETCHRRWRLRTPPVAFRVVQGFPRLTPDLLGHTDAEGGHITDIRYRIDLTDRTPDTPPGILSDALSAGQQELA